MSDVKASPTAPPPEAPEIPALPASPDTVVPVLKLPRRKTTGRAAITHAAKDSALVAEFKELTLRRAPTAAQEVLNFSRADEGRNALSRLAGKTAASPKELESARSYVGMLNDHLRLARRFNKPATQPIPRRRGPITLNGKLDDAGWAAATIIPLNFPVNHLEPTAECNGTARLAWDEERLFVGYRICKPEINAPPFPRNGPVCTFDCVEIFLLPQPRSRTYWEYNLSPSGCVFEAYFCKHRDRPYSFRKPRPDMAGLGVTINTNPRPHADGKGPGYIIEMSIRWAELPGMRTAPQPGDTIHGLLAMSYVFGPGAPHRQAFIGHTPMLTSFHNIACFSPFELTD